MIRAGGRTTLLYHVWERHHREPWKVLGVKWLPCARKAWYLAAETVHLEDQLTAVQRREAERRKAETDALIAKNRQRPAVRPGVYRA